MVTVAINNYNPFKIKLFTIADVNPKFMFPFSSNIQTWHRHEHDTNVLTNKVIYVNEDNDVFVFRIKESPLIKNKCQLVKCCNIF